LEFPHLVQVDARNLQTQALGLPLPALTCLGLWSAVSSPEKNLQLAQSQVVDIYRYEEAMETTIAEDTGRRR